MSNEHIRRIKAVDVYVKIVHIFSNYVLFLFHFVVILYVLHGAFNGNESLIQIVQE